MVLSYHKFIDMNAHQTSEKMFHARLSSLATLSSTTRCGKEGVDNRWLLELLLVGSEGEEQVERGDGTLLLCFSSANCQ